MKKYISILILCAGIVTNASAQTFTQRIQQRTTGQGTVTVHQSTDIDQLVNEANLTNGKASPTTHATPTTSTTPTKPTPPAATLHSPIESTDGANATADASPVDHTKKIMRGYKVNGYRVQAFAGGNTRKDRLQAERTGDEIKASFPDVPVYVHFYSPRWICRIGNFRTYEEAHQMLLSVRKMGFTQATIVKGKITVQD
jgi:hypothetical protein